jgi:VIT1/CCC1 family predicted Fe2+/Mn2+ transporter
MDRISEILFGLIMVISVTCTVSLGAPGSIKSLLIASLGCNIAWGIIDATFYVMVRFSERAQGVRALQALRVTADSRDVQRILASALPPVVADALTPVELEAIRERLNQIPELPKAQLEGADWAAAGGVFLLVFLSTLPVVTPFVLFSSARTALRISNGIAIAMLFGVGCTFGQYSGRRAWPMGLGMVAIGGVLVGITIALGG